MCKMKEVCKSKEVRLVMAFIFVLFAVALVTKFYHYNKFKYSEAVVKTIQANDGTNFICINQKTGKAFETNKDNFELMVVQGAKCKNVNEYKILFTEEKVSFHPIDCSKYKVIKK